MECLIFLLMLVPAWSLPARNPMENPNLYQGDIVLQNYHRNRRNAVATNDRIWPGGVIPYKIRKEKYSMKDKIEQAMEHIMNRTCIKFVPWDGKQRGHLNIFRGEGCYAGLGYSGIMQPLSLGFGCEPLSTIYHELIHAIGFYHEHSRSDRDDYVVIHWKNMYFDERFQFDKLKPSQNRLFNGFDYESVMLYGETSWSYDGKAKTMTAKKKGMKLLSDEEKNNISESDIYRINALYECDKKE